MTIRTEAMSQASQFVELASYNRNNILGIERAVPLSIDRLQMPITGMFRIAYAAVSTSHAEKPTDWVAMTPQPCTSSK